MRDAVRNGSIAIHSSTRLRRPHSKMQDMNHDEEKFQKSLGMRKKLVVQNQYSHPVLV
jgi:hypothetical protein